MKNVALIFAGGTGTRMNNKARPKQFLELDGRAIIIHTLNHFENHPAIDAICVVCLESWIDYLKELLQRFAIKKVRWIVPGGSTGQESIYNGLKAIHDSGEADDDCAILVHDGVRPLISEKVLTDNIECVHRYGSAITVAPAVETLITSNENFEVQEIYNRDRCHFARAPQSFLMKDLWEAHEKARAEGIMNMIDSACLMKHYGHSLQMVEGPSENIKITTPMDFFLFKAIYETQRSSQVFGI
jgi:2-C-methyl-D-erythritol 4-phosphate cytidylyltransferase